MKSVQIKNVPDEVHAELHRRAAIAGHSLQQYLLRLLDQETRCAAAEEVFARAGGRSGWEMSISRAAELVRADRDSHMVASRSEED